MKHADSIPCVGVKQKTILADLQKNKNIRFVNPMKGCNAHDLTHHSERPI